MLQVLLSLHCDGINVIRRKSVGNNLHARFLGRQISCEILVLGKMNLTNIIFIFQIETNELKN
jgi:hypothetical protein